MANPLEIFAIFKVNILGGISQRIAANATFQHIHQKVINNFGIFLEGCHISRPRVNFFANLKFKTLAAIGSNMLCPIIPLLFNFDLIRQSL
jgi:hypothetical protein